MPELPEVETVRRGLERLVAPGTRIESVQALRRDLRIPFPPRLGARLCGRPIEGFRRWGKYLLWDLSDVVLVSHLGMTGSWRLAPPGDEREHDHLYLHLAGGARLALRDPRRFGLVDLVRPGHERASRWLATLGPDPLDPGGFSTDWLRRAFAGRRAPVKALLLDQSIAAGVGNIYAAEALHRAGIRPSRPAGSISLPRLARLVDEIRAVLLEAIDAGGSTIRDFGSTEGETGWFQGRFRVYGREGLPCRACGATLRAARIGQRATVWCPRCQR